MPFCGKCGAEMPEGAKFCSTCGASAEQAPDSPVAPAAQQPAPEAQPAQEMNQQPQQAVEPQPAADPQLQATYQQPQPNYQQPPYQQPQPNYQQPPYQQSQPNYQQPPYQQPQPNYQQTPYQQPVGRPDPVPHTAGVSDYSNYMDPYDVQQNKAICGLAYLFDILFFLPLVTNSSSKNCRFHSNQALLLLFYDIASAILSVILVWIPILGPILVAAIYIFRVVLWIMGMVNGFGGHAKELPLIGAIRIIK